MTLYYFTASYPFGLGEVWKSNELKELVNDFDEITIIPFHYADNFKNPKPLEPGVKLLGPLFTAGGWPLKKTDILTILFHRNIIIFLREFFRQKVYGNKKKLFDWLGGTMTSIRLLKHPVIKKIIEEGNKQTVLYFYWGRGCCEFLPFINTDIFYKVFVRMHNYDLFEHEGNYIPYKFDLLNHISIAGPSSLAGKRHLESIYPKAKASVQVVRCGTIDNNKRSKPSNDGVMRVVSCSFLSPIKRVNLMIECLKFIDFPIEWHHVGDGILRKELEELVRVQKADKKFIFHGMIDSRLILDFYTEHSFDLFVNTSKGEGVPFSIMEAFSVGLPVMATDVGGSGEIVNDTIGKLLPADISAKDLAREISSFYSKPESEKLYMRDEAYRMYKENCDAKELAKQLAVLLKN